MNYLIKIFFGSGKSYLVISVVVIFCVHFFISCKGKTRPNEKVMVQAPEQMDAKVEELIQNFLDYADSKNGRLEDSTILYQLPILINLYKQKSFIPQWSSSQKWLKQGDSLLHFIENVKYYGLFPSDYHSHQLH